MGSIDRINGIRAVLDHALGEPRGEDLISGVKSAVIAELETLDPSIDIKSTDYFNHSFIPDLTLSWKEAGKSITRDVFLRYSLRSAAIGGDVEALADMGPILLALQEDEDRRVVEAAGREVEDVQSLLLTDVPALSDIGSGSYEVRSRSAPEAASPLLDLVRSNVVRGGRVLFVSRTAREIREKSRSSDDLNVELENIQSFTEMTGRLFREDAAARLMRAAQILRAGLTGDINMLELTSSDQADGEEDNGLPAVLHGHGRLSDGELSVLIPYLLRRDDVTASPRFWAYVGSMMSLDRLESMWEHFTNVDLTPLVAANVDSWFASRALLSFNVEEADSASDLLDVRSGWNIHARALSLVVGGWRLHMAVDGRKLKGRDGGGRASTWMQLRPVLRDYLVSSVVLQGISRRLQISARRGNDIFRDIETITDSIDDRYVVPGVEVRTSPSEDAGLVSLDLVRMLAEVSGSVTIRELAEVALRILGHRNPVDLDVLASVLGDQ